MTRDIKSKMLHTQLAHSLKYKMSSYSVKFITFKPIKTKID
jgi:hypothetical protein